MNPEPIPTRLKADAPGLGEPSETEIEQRAAELAKSDGRDAFTDGDLARAAAELGGALAEPAAPEIEPEVARLTEWDEPPAATGEKAPGPALDDENSAAERLVRDGIEEADHDTRVEAEDDRGE